MTLTKDENWWRGAVIYQIYPRSYQDSNGDGVIDAGEPGLVGVTVFIDSDNDGVLDAGELSTTTDANGDWTIPVTDVLPDEFGGRAFSFIAPDGYTWTLLQA